jgi:hypothetical protein
LIIPLAGAPATGKINELSAVPRIGRAILVGKPFALVVTDIIVGTSTDFDVDHVRVRVIDKAVTVRRLIDAQAKTKDQKLPV